MPSRRELIQLTDAEMRAYAVSARTLIIVSNGKDGFPHPMPMWFYADADLNFYCTTFRKSQKVLNFQRDPRATLLIESGEEYAELKSLVAYCHTEVLDDLDTVTDTLVHINSKGRALDDEQLARLRGGVVKTAEKRVVLKFTPERFVSWDHVKLGGQY
jgi:nitroimidazol reductase NimA-like FMN-containing flavoprotein (pyridoxamine 5'-phosphate oxidase superfamily)